MQVSEEATQATGEHQKRRRQLYGRRVGRALTAEMDQLLKAELPRLRVDLGAPSAAPASLFPHAVNDVWLEVGFGGGEHLVWQATQNPAIGIIGCEPFLTGVAKVIRDSRDAALTNIRLHDDDARQLLEWLPEASIGRIFVLFPDPWPKNRHHKRRFLHESTLGSLARVLRPGSHLRFATDIANYADMVLAGMANRRDFAASPGLHTERPADWPPTRYEEKARNAGRKCQFFSFQRV